MDFPAPADLPVQENYPDPLLMRDGRPVTDRILWEERRKPELRTLFEHYLYGARPPRPRVSGLVRYENPFALNGAATLRTIEVDLGLGNPIQLMLVLPNNAAGASPCFLALNFSGNYTLTDDPGVALPNAWISKKFAGVPEENRASEAARGRRKEAWDIGQAIARGYAIATFYHGEIVPDQPALAAPILHRINRDAASTSGTATLMAWAWGLSCMLDYLETVPEIDALRVTTVGHSRNGKAALLATAFDDRFAMAIANQSGCGGAAPSRSAPRPAEAPPPETLGIMQQTFPHWLCPLAATFAENPAKLPFDQHSLIALCAPRPVLLSNAAEDHWADPPGQLEMLRAAAPVYELVTGETISPLKMPALGRLLNQRLGYYIREGKHSITAGDWSTWFDYADRWLR